MDGQENTITWSVLTHTHKDRSTDWYWAFGLVAVVGIAASIFFKNYMLAGILAIGMGSIAVLVARGPREHTVRIDKRGVVVDGTRYPFKSIKSFWVEVEEELDEPDPDYVRQARLFLTTSGVLSPHMVVPLDDVAHAAQVRDYLVQHVQEEEQHPHFAEHLADILGL